MTTEVQLLKLPEVLSRTKKSRTSVLVGVRKGEFPKPVKLGSRSVAWIASEVDAWIEACANARFSEQGGENA